MNPDTEYIQIKPDEFAALDFKIAVKVSEISPFIECDCWVCDKFSSHTPPLKGKDKI